MTCADVGSRGCHDIPTPNLDKLAASGVRFNPGGAVTGLPTSEMTIADRLHAPGYKSALIGTWHLGGKEAMQRQRRGAEGFFGFLGAGNQGAAAAKLYNLRDDIGEGRDLATAQLDKVGELQSK